ncbi:plasmid mobilization relaxosome protein MobC [Dyadobacter sp. LJ53]|uniref:plasmid mobilization protein n=1 Tax=Dyadobacter chenwenxiniae TaxID=2906456 RepID=UPI001F413F52|nr:plasmid mobilization relaxosome protein MobC [Dyadobacter chenwenxiniae]MCF0049276.1 plasmid mobilization relaxosome protein MobC [Dyadobacter chenwenxiniae]
MRDENNNRNKWLHLRLNSEEYQQVQKHFKRTTCRKISEYARKILLSKPVTVNHRNASLDELMGELIHLRNELTAAGNNFNQAVKKLNSLSRISQFHDWITEYESDKRKLLGQIEEIKNHIAQTSKKWLQ